MNTDKATGVLALLALLALGAAGWWSVRLALADGEFRTGTPEGVGRAVELTPLNTAYLSLQALQAGYQDAGPVLLEIARLTPDASAPRIRLGLEAEARGDAAGAERWLLEAARVDHQYEPRWTLANFYFRERKTDEFWKWIRAALEVSYGNRDAAFELCWRTVPDAAVIVARGIPDRHAVVAALLDYLSRTGRGDGAAVAIRLSQWHDAGDLPGLEAEMDRLVAAGRRAEAKEVWMNLGYAEPPASGNLVVHPDFEVPRVGHGFDWRLMENAGVSFTQFDSPPELRISFTGKQPEACELLEQLVGVRKDRRYRLRWESRGVAGDQADGVVWRAGTANAVLRAGGDWMAGELMFVADRDGDRIELRYERPVGEPRTEGAIELRHIAVEEAR